jgi:nitrate/TMAO reductase-like tetraheme cytochrome c subunit
MNHWRRYLLVIGLASVVVVPTGLIWGGRVLERLPSFCASCHEMQPSYDGWMASGAAKDHPDCIGCHSREGIAGVFEAELQGVRMIGIHYFGKRMPGQAIHAVMPEAFCLKCHASEKVLALHSMLQTQGRTCSDCHKHRVGWKFKGQVQP